VSGVHPGLIENMRIFERVPQRRSQMNYRNFGLIISAFVVSLSFTPAAFACEEGNTSPECNPEEPPPPPSKTKGNNGLGNGDQAAPGNSLANNKAENLVTAVNGGEHPSGKPQIPD
jgi:hypothetical protein